MSTRAEIRHMHIADDVPKKEVARRLGVDIKTVRRHLSGGAKRPAQGAPRRPRALDPYRAEIEKLIERDAMVSAKRIGRLLEVNHGLRVSARSIRRYVNEVRGTTRKPEAFVHRTHLPGETMEIDFGETWCELDGRRTKIFFFVATLPGSNVYFSKAYRHQRIECLLDGISSAIEWIGGVPSRVVFDNASTAVKKILKGEERVETERFHNYRAELALGADFCNPASGWEKGSAERGVQYIRRLMLSALPPMKDLDELNAHMLCEIDVDMDRRTLRDGTTVRRAFEEERLHLRPLPLSLPCTARVLSCTADKYGHVRIDRSTYSVPTDCARRTLTARLYHDSVEVINGLDVVATHTRSTKKAEYVLALDHVLELLERKPRSAREATVIRQMGLPACFDQLRIALRKERRQSDKEWVQILGLLVDYPLESVRQAIEQSLERGAIGLTSVKQLLRHGSQPRLAIEPVDITERGLIVYEIRPADLSRYGSLLERTPA
jgi:transposase